MILGLYLPLKYFIKFQVQENLYKVISKGVIGNEIEIIYIYIYIYTHTHTHTYIYITYIYIWH